jgi:hypothetical protein
LSAIYTGIKLRWIAIIYIVATGIHKATIVTFSISDPCPFASLSTIYTGIKLREIAIIRIVAAGRHEAANITLSISDPSPFATLSTIYTGIKFLRLNSKCKDCQYYILIHYNILITMPLLTFRFYSKEHTEKTDITDKHYKWWLIIVTDILRFNASLTS